MCTHLVLILFLLYHEPIGPQELPKQRTRIRLKTVDGFHENLLMTGANIGLKDEILIRFNRKPGLPSGVHRQYAPGRLPKQFFYIRKRRQTRELARHTLTYVGFA